jgi:hypothetical protein
LFFFQNIHAVSNFKKQQAGKFIIFLPAFYQKSASLKKP